MPDTPHLRRALVSAWRDFGIWPRSARRTTITLTVFILVFLPAACAGSDPSTIDDETSTTTEASPSTTEATRTTGDEEPTTKEPPTTEAPSTTASPSPPTTPAPRPPTTPAPASGTSFANCSEARAAGAAPLSRGEPGYSSKLDRDGDGIACET